MNRFDDVWYTMYINGIVHNVTGESIIYADSPDFPKRRCSCHRLGTNVMNYIKEGGKVKTLGNTYSLKAYE